MDPDVVILKNENTQIYLLGTNHVLKSSSVKAVQLIQQVKPQTVFLEIDPSEVSPEEVLDPATFGVSCLRASDFSWIQALSPSYSISFLHTYLFAVYEDLLDTQNGMEFCTAANEARRQGAKVILGDCPYEGRLTQAIFQDLKLYLDCRSRAVLMKEWAKSNKEEKDTNEPDQRTFEILTRLWNTLEPPLASDKRYVIDTVSKWFGEDDEEPESCCFPNVTQVFHNDRDRFMTEGLRKLNGTVVGVVGQAHLDGIRKLWNDPSAYERTLAKRILKDCENAQMQSLRSMYTRRDENGHYSGLISLAKTMGVAGGIGVGMRYWRRIPVPRRRYIRKMTFRGGLGLFGTGALLLGGTLAYNANHLDKARDAWVQTQV